MKNLIQYIYFTIIFLLISCADGKQEIPIDVIPEDKMVDVITEIEITQALIKLTLSTQDTINQQQLFDKVYEDFNISEEKFNKSLSFYCRQPKVMENIYVRVIISLSKKQAER
ncbi:MAG: hypothetical protein COA97_05260 [Flavobacteriales bacterium]|nr:MAG: hypothetical protein COA97_05260 [Flavobacteriales bacterium]